VLRARSLLVALGSMPVIYDDENLCFSGNRPHVEDRSDKAQSAGLWVFPNPASSLLNVAWYGETNENKTFALYDVFGRIVKTVIMGDSAGSVQIETDDLPAGVYVYRVSNGQLLLRTGKFSVQH
jgi:hypothetical protein